MSSEAGLRDRKRRRTRTQISDAAVALVLDHGLHAVTVEAIAQRADVSPRTFFNYYESKDDALLGIHDVDITTEWVEAHRARFQDSGLAESVIALLFAVLAPYLNDPKSFGARLEVVRRYPHLLGRQLAQMTRMNRQLTAAITAIAADHDTVAISPADADVRAEMLLAVCGGAVRVVARQWVESLSADVDDLPQRAALLVRDLVRTLR